MNQVPVIDQLFNAIVTGDPEAWHQIEVHHAEGLVHMRALVCSDEVGSIDLDLGLGITPNEYVVPIFEGPRAKFVSRHTSVQARLTGGRSNVLLDYSLSFDSNFAEKLRATLEGEAIQAIDRARVLEVLKLKANNARVQFDLVPFLYENVRLARTNKLNARPLNTLIAFRMLDHLDWEAFRNNPGCFEFGRDKAALKSSLEPEADKFLSSLFNSPEVALHEAKSLAMRALLLRFALLWHEPKTNPKRILGQLIDYCVFNLGFLPTTELSLIWAGIGGKQRVPFFGPIVGKSKDMLEAISGMAWDMTHLRIMERLASQSKLGSFYIPYFVSLDKKWRALLRMNPIRFTLFDDSTKAMLHGRVDELSFQMALNTCTSERARNEMAPEKVGARRLAAKAITVERMNDLVAEEERHWR